jgi:hypothetical protein
LTLWLFSAEQPHAPIRHVFGKSCADRQQLAVVTVPPESVHAFSFEPVWETQPTDAIANNNKEATSNFDDICFYSPRSLLHRM